jgi:hypothetical protein
MTKLVKWHYESIPFVLFVYHPTPGLTGVPVFITILVSLGKDEEKKGKGNAALTENPRCLGTFNGLTTGSKNLSLSWWRKQMWTKTFFQAFDKQWHIRCFVCVVSIFYHFFKAVLIEIDKNKFASSNNLVSLRCWDWCCSIPTNPSWGFLPRFECIHLKI